MATSSQKRRARNEQAIQGHNRGIERSVANLAGSAGMADVTLHLDCECADPACQQTVMVQMYEYKVATALKNRFVIIPDHEQSDIEKVIESHPEYAVVQKNSDVM